MAYASRETELFRRGADSQGRPLDSDGREQLLKPYLPAPRPTSPVSPSLKPQSTPSKSAATSAYSSSSFQVNQLLYKRKSSPIRSWIANLLHRLLFFLIHLAFSIYIRLRQAYHALLDRTFSILYYHHRTPELIQRDVKNLQRLPRHLSVIVDLQAEGAREQAGPEGLSRLITEVSELSAWCTCVGIPFLSVYERTGTLKAHMPSLHAEVRKTLNSYFPPASEPTIHMHAAPDNTSSYTPQQSSSADETSELEGEQQSEKDMPHSQRPHINILLMSASDGRATLVDLTKTLAEMAQRGKLSPADISPELIHAEIEESVCREPDLLVVMAPAEGRQAHVGRKGRRRRRSKRRSSSSSARARAVLSGDVSTEQDFVGGGGVCLQGYPPWQVRLTEIFYVQDNAGVGYQIFLRALHRYAKAEMRFGR